jgi:hypothetical protein
MIATYEVLLALITGLLEAVKEKLVVFCSAGRA